jgi:RNA polymerase sigma factor (sigma-70 family)
LTDELDDHALLDQFVREADAEAFAELLRRHGVMVRATCNRHLGDTPDADDAFQSVFLVLVRKASSIRQRELLGPWLHAVSVRCSRKALALRQRRQSHERLVTTMPEPCHEPDEPPDWLPLLDDAVQSLPEKYRVPLVLCELEGLSRAMVAEKLSLAPGTLSSRLARGRDLLRQRLVRRGVSVSAVALAATLASHASASVPPDLLQSTTQVALTGILSAPVAAITQGVLHAMFIAKMKFVAVVVIGLSVLLMGAGILTWQLTAQPPAAQQPAAKTDKDALQGEWKVVGTLAIGQAPKQGNDVKGRSVVFKGDKVVMQGEGQFMLDPSKTPKELDIIPTEGPAGEKGKKFRAIYELKGDDLKISFNGPDQPRPKNFDEPGRPGAANMGMILKRAGPNGAGAGEKAK